MRWVSEALASGRRIFGATPRGILGLALAATFPLGLLVAVAGWSVGYDAGRIDSCEQAFPQDRSARNPEAEQQERDEHRPSPRLEIVDDLPRPVDLRGAPFEGFYLVRDLAESQFIAGRVVHRDQFKVYPAVHVAGAQRVAQAQGTDQNSQGCNGQPPVPPLDQLACKQANQDQCKADYEVCWTHGELPPRLTGVYRAAWRHA